MSLETMALTAGGFRAWQRGEFAALEAILDPDVHWTCFEPGRDCNNRDEVMQLLAERYEQGFAKSELEFIDATENALVVVAHPGAIGGEGWPDEPATLLTFRQGKVVDMRDYRTRTEALAAGDRI
jgi:ketosteroid isomerase-like protein